MFPDFSTEFRCYLENQKIDFSEQDSIFHIGSPAINVRLVKLSDGKNIRSGRADITLYEDEWHTKFSQVSKRVLSNIGMQKSVFARCCKIEIVTSEVAKEFLENNHILGYAKSRFKYGLFAGKDMADIRTGTLIAVATFSAPRPMDRSGRVVQSYEWVRYASKSGYRVIGGMGKLMKHFVEIERPDEIMSYADKDWGNGDVYRKLGFKHLCDTPPIEFYVHKKTLIRISEKKLRNDHEHGVTPEININDYYILRNQGNLKFLWTPTLVK